MKSDANKRRRVTQLKGRWPRVYFRNLYLKKSRTDALDDLFLRIKTKPDSKEALEIKAFLGAFGCD